LGGVESLSAQKRWLCERVVYLRQRCLAYEAAVLHNANLLEGQQERALPMDAGTYSNHANVLQGYLRTLGIERQARPARTLAQVMRGDAACAERPGVAQERRSGEHPARESS
jgi:hypothetical protein